MSKCTKVCGTCPWRRSAPLGFWEVDHYTKISYALSGVARELDIHGAAAGRVRMGCHQWNGWKRPGLSPRDSPPCGGWTRVVGVDGVAIAGLLGAGVIGLADVTPGPLAGELYPNVTTMVRWNGVRVEALPALDDPKGLLVLRHTPNDDLVVEGSPLSHRYEQRDPGGLFRSRMPRPTMAAWRRRMQRLDRSR